jgi:hypothetical protein
MLRIRFRRSNPGSPPSISVGIEPDAARNDTEQDELRSFSEKGGWNQLPNMVAEAERAMGLQKDLAKSSRFSKDILKVEIWRPDQQPLTLVDLPGMIQVDNRKGADVAMVKDIVNAYISNPRSIILAVVSASNDAENQVILRKAKQIDPEGKRTFGIITKPDLTGEGSDHRKSWIDLAQNRKEFKFQKGWHVLLNRTFNEVRDQTSSDVRDQNERRFFSNPRNEWSEIKAGSWGIEALRNRLRNLLYDLTRSQLPLVQRDITIKLDKYDERLKALNARLKSQEEMWNMFRNKCDDLVDLVEKGESGKIHDPFYGIGNPNKKRPDIRYLRSKIENQNDALYEAMKSRGRGIPFLEFPNESDDVPPIDDRWVKTAYDTLKQTRGVELEGQTDPQRLVLLFWEYSSPWFDIASEHIRECFHHCERFIHYVVDSQLKPELPGLGPILWNEVLHKALGERKENAEKELMKLEEDRNRPVKTRNKAYLDKALRVRKEKCFHQHGRAVHADNNGIRETDLGLNPNTLAKDLNLHTFDKIKWDEAEKLLTEMLIYYNVSNCENSGAILAANYRQIARDVFIDNVSIQVIERHLLVKLNRVFSNGMGIKRERFNQIWKDEDYDARELERDEVQKERNTLWECLNKVASAFNEYS